MMVTWFRQIDNAKGPLEVVAIARDYMATWTPAEIGRLPERCRPGKLRDETDIANLHAQLVEEYRTTRASGEDLKALQELTSFLVRASIRIAELLEDGAKGSAGVLPGGSSKSASAEG